MLHHFGLCIGTGGQLHFRTPKWAHHQSKSEYFEVGGRFTGMAGYAMLNSEDRADSTPFHALTWLRIETSSSSAQL